MDNKELDSTAELPIEKFELYKCVYDFAQPSNQSESDYIEIDFPKARIIRFLNNDTIEFSANYEKIEEQLKYYSSNNTISL